MVEHRRNDDIHHHHRSPFCLQTSVSILMGPVHDDGRHDVAVVVVAVDLLVLTVSCCDTKTISDDVASVPIPAAVVGEDDEVPRDRQQCHRTPPLLHRQRVDRLHRKQTNLLRSLPP
jgi:hypothetical protein